MFLFISFFKSFRFNWIGLVWSGSINWSFLKPKPKPNRIKWFFFIFNRFIQFFLSVQFFKLIFSQFFWFNRLIGFFLTSLKSSGVTIPYQTVQQLLFLRLQQNSICLAISPCSYSLSYLLCERRRKPSWQGPLSSNHINHRFNVKNYQNTRHTSLPKCSKSCQSKKLKNRKES